jgi:hypothetical protein
VSEPAASSDVPFSYETQSDPLTGKTDGILARCTLRRTCPKIIDTLPFARTKGEREANGDPRHSLEERYRDKADYVTKVRQAAATLEREGYLLAEDVHRIVDRAAATAW